MLSRLYHFKGNYLKSTEMRDRFHSIIPNEYNAVLNESIKLLNVSNDTEAALELIDKAIPLAGEDGTWKYNKLYLLIKLNKELEGLRMLDNILSTDYEDEDDSIQQVISYNRVQLEKDPEHIQTNFIIGVLLIEKKNSPIKGYDYLKTFLNDSIRSDRFEQLRNRTKIYLDEIDGVIGVDDDKNKK